MQQVPLSTRGMEAARRLRRTDTWIIDALMASTLLVVGTITFVASRDSELEGLRDPDLLGYLLLLGVITPFYARRRWPFLVFTISTGFMALLVAGDYETNAASQALLIGTYTIGAYCERRERLAGLGMLAFAFLVVIVTEVPALDGGGILVNIGFFAAAYFFGSTVRNRRLYIDEVEARAIAAERERDEEARRAVADERLRIAQELHDVVAHSMGVIAVQAGVGAHVCETDPAEAKRSLEAISQVSRNTLAEIRRMLGVLREDDGVEYAPAPGLADLDRLLRDVRGAGLDVDVAIDGDDGSIPRGVDFTAYRIVQEALTNVLKHAGPARASVRVAYEPAALRLEIVDDGRGVNGRAEHGGGHGLLGMRERVAVFGGSFEAGPRVGGGFRVVARLPYGEDA